MNQRAQIRMLPDGRRLHMHDGPIDVIVEAFGATARSRRLPITRLPHAFRRRCWMSCAASLRILRRPARADGALPSGAVARRMVAAVMPYAAETFITPMAAVAGAVAEEILEAMIAAAKLSRAYVNDGGDIALHLAPGEKFVVGMVERPDRASLCSGPRRACGPIPCAGLRPAAGEGAVFRSELPMQSPCSPIGCDGRRCGDDHRQCSGSAGTSDGCARSGVRTCARQRSRASDW